MKEKADLQAEIDYCNSVLRVLEGEDRGLFWLVNWNAMVGKDTDPVRLMIPPPMREDILQQMSVHYQYQLTEAKAKLQSLS